MLRKTVLATMVAVACSSAHAGTDIYFNPLTQAASVAQVPGHVNELSNPWLVPAGVSYVNLTSISEIEADPDQSAVRVPGLGNNAVMFDMSAFDPTGRYIFLPHETQYGAGLTRYDMKTNKAVNLIAGDMNGSHGDWSADYGAFDPATWSPVNTVLLGEEWSGQGRIFEVLNPMADPADIQLRELTSIPNVSHEGLRFNHAGTALYFIDEDRSGSIYKYVPSVKGDYSKGQTFVLVVATYAGNPSVNATSANRVDRVGPATWVALTDADGNKLTTVDPFNNEPLADGRRSGRAAADEMGGTPYSRPEDVEVGYLGNGHEVLYFNATGTRTVYSVEELDNNKAYVRLAADASTSKNKGYAATSGTLNDIDNMAQDALGNIYLVEDWPNGSNYGGNIWLLRDTDNDGVAESLDHFMSLQVKGAENTGMIFRPGHPTQFIVSVQHPESTGAGGQGDAVWLLDVKNVVPPPCQKEGAEDRDGVKSCNEADNSNFIKKLISAGK